MELTVTNRSQAYPKALKKAIGRVNKSENDIYNKLYVVLRVHKVPDYKRGQVRKSLKSTDEKLRHWRNPVPFLLKKDVRKSLNNS